MTDSAIRSRLIAVASLFLAAAAMGICVQNVAWSRNAQRVVERLGLAARRPVEVQAMRLEAETDLEADLLATASLEDSDADRAANRSQAARQELLEIRNLLRDALRIRPGRAYHLFLLARVGRELGGAKSPESWFGEMRLAAATAPGSDEIAESFARAILDSWADLKSGQRAEAAAILHRALADPNFVTAELLRIRAFLGQQEALLLIPDDPACLQAAEQALRSGGQVQAAAAVAARRGVRSTSP